MHLLSTTWQTCIKAYSHESLNSNRAPIYQKEGKETVNIKMLKGTIFVGYHNRNFFYVPNSPTVTNFGSVKIGIDAS